MDRRPFLLFFSLGCDLNKDSSIDWSTEQDKDPVIHEVKQRLLEPLTQGDMSSEARKLWKEQKVLQIVNGQLARRRSCSGEEQSQLILPRNYRELALKYVHDEMGHLGRDRTLDFFHSLWISQETA